MNAFFYCGLVCQCSATVVMCIAEREFIKGKLEGRSRTNPKAIITTLFQNLLMYLSPAKLSLAFIAKKNTLKK